MFPISRFLDHGLAGYEIRPPPTEPGIGRGEHADSMHVRPHVLRTSGQNSTSVHLTEEL